MKRKLLYLILPLITLVLEILPYGAVCNFADGYNKIHRVTYSYFDLTPFGYANFAPLLTAIISCGVIILLIIYLFIEARNQKKGAIHNEIYLHKSRSVKRSKHRFQGGSF